MDPTAASRQILEKRYHEQFQRAEASREQDNKQQAADAYREAAETLEGLSEIAEDDFSEQIENLREAADILSRGEPLQSDSPDASTREGAADQPDKEARKSNSDTSDDEDALREQAESFVASTDVTWADIGGLQDVQQELKRSIALGAHPDTPPAISLKGILLFGPPGTGKTLLASAVAGSLDATFFEVSLGGLLSKYFGESSQQISALFDVAEQMSPSVIFLDEVDALTQSRDSGQNNASRRVLNTLLSELDGLKAGDDSFVLPLASTNTPWDLDAAIRRRFEKRILVPIPGPEAAHEIVQVYTEQKGMPLSGPARAVLPEGTPNQSLTPEQAVARECVRRHFSGHDIELLCKEAISETLHAKNPELVPTFENGGMDALAEYPIETSTISPEQMVQAFDSISASLSADERERYQEWDREFGSAL